MEPPLRRVVWLDQSLPETRGESDAEAAGPAGRRSCSCKLTLLFIPACLPVLHREMRRSATYRLSWVLLLTVIPSFCIEGFFHLVCFCIIQMGIFYFYICGWATFEHCVFNKNGTTMTALLAKRTMYFWSFDSMPTVCPRSILSVPSVLSAGLSCERQGPSQLVRLPFLPRQGPIGQ